MNDNRIDPNAGLRTLESRIRDLRRAAELAHHMICDQYDAEFVRWMADRLLEETNALEADFDRAWAVAGNG